MFEETGYTDGIDSFRGMVVSGAEEVVTGDDESPKKKDSTDSSSDDGTLDSEEARPIATDGLPEVEELDLEELDPSIFALDNLPETTPVDDRGNILPPEEVFSTYAGVGDVDAGAVYDNRPEMTPEVLESYKEHTAKWRSQNETQAAEAEATALVTAEEEDVSRVEALEADVDFLTAVEAIDEDFIDAPEGRGQATQELRDNLSDYGITVREGSWATDNIVLVANDGTETVVDMDNLWGDGEEATRVRTWVNNNASAKKVEDVDKTTRTEMALRAKNLRTGGRVNSDGTTSSVNMTVIEEDGKFKVVPTLFPIDPNFQSARADRWMDLGENLDEAMQVATDRNEVFT